MKTLREELEGSPDDRRAERPRDAAPRADAVPPPGIDAPKATRRARRRLLGNGAVATLAAVAIALAGLASVRSEAPGSGARRRRPSTLAARRPSRLRGARSRRGSTRRSTVSRSATRPAGGHGRRPNHGRTTRSPSTRPTSTSSSTHGSGITSTSPSARTLGSKSPKDWVYDTLSENILVDQICQPAEAAGPATVSRATLPGSRNATNRDGARRSHVVFATPTRGYIIYIHVADEQRHQATYDAHWFGAGRDTRTVELPEDAPDTSSPSASP